MPIILIINTNNSPAPVFPCPGSLGRPMRHDTASYFSLMKCVTTLITLIFLRFDPYLSNDIEILDLLWRISSITSGSKCVNISWIQVATVVLEVGIAFAACILAIWKARSSRFDDALQCLIPSIITHSKNAFLNSTCRNGITRS